MTDNTPQEEFFCKTCGQMVPASGWYYYKKDYYNRGVKQRKIGSRMIPCIKCKHNNKADWQARKRGMEAQNKQPTPTDLSWNSLLGVKPVKTEVV